MSVRTLAAATALALACTLVPAAAQAAKPTYKVSVAASAAKADVGQTLRLTGKVSGPKAAKKKVYLQQRIGSGAWRTIASTRTAKSRAYAFRTTIATAGAQSFRVYAPKSKKARAGYSGVRALVGWRWLNLVQQPTTIESYGGGTGGGSANWIYTGTFANEAGTAFPWSYRLLINPKNMVRITASRTGCDRFRATISTRAGADPVDVNSAYAAPAIDLTLNGGANQLIDTGLNSLYSTMDLSFYTPVGYVTVLVGSPRLHCSVNALPQP